MKNIDELYRDVVPWIRELILKDEVRLRDVPPDVRRLSDGLPILKVTKMTRRNKR